MKNSPTQFLSGPQGQILVVESKGTWTSSLRQLANVNGVEIKRILDWHCIPSDGSTMPTAALIEVQENELTNLVKTMVPLFARKDWFICWLIGRAELSFFELEIQRLGFSGVLTSLTELNLLHQRISRFFEFVTPPELSLESRIARQFPWRDA